MNPLLFYLFVEGKQDVSFVRCVLALPERVKIVSADSVDASGPTIFGNKERVLAVANVVGDRCVGFVDRDFDDAAWESHPDSDRVVLTDGRDLEGYVLRCGDLSPLWLAFRHEPPRSHSDIVDILNLVLQPVGRLRFASQQNELRLPFQSTDFADDVTGAEPPALDLDRYRKRLMDKAGLGSADRAAVATLTDSVDVRHLDACQLVHGKDVVRFLRVWVSRDLSDANVFGCLRPADTAGCAALDKIRTICSDWLAAHPEPTAA